MNNGQAIQFHRCHRGVALLYVMVAVIGMCAVGSLALDYGRAQVVKTELRRAAEAAAMAALAEIRSGNGITAAQNAAVSVAASNLAEGSAVVVDPDADIEFGSYDGSTDTFTVLSGTARASAQAIHVTCRRTAARGNAVNLVLGPVIGKNSVDVTDDAVAAVNSTSRYNFVGLDSASLRDLDADSFDSSVGAYGGANVKGNAAIASNGNLTFANTCHIHSEAHPGPGGTITKDGGTELGTKSPFSSGNYPVLSPYTANLSETLYYPLPDASAYATSNDNSQLASKLDGSNNLNINGDLTVTGGTFYINNFTMADKKLTFNSKTIIYVTGTITVDGEIKTYLTNPCNLSIYVLGSGAVTFTRSKNFYGTLYAPLSAVTMNNGDCFGQIIGKTLSITSGSHKWHYDEALANGSDGGPAKKKWIKKARHWIR